MLLGAVQRVILGWPTAGRPFFVVDLSPGYATDALTINTSCKWINESIK